MCFRPADAAAAGPRKCPECGEMIQSGNGIVLKSCPFCKCDLVPYLNGKKAAPIAPGTPAVSADRGNPGAPKAPGVPKAPGA